ncbi:DMT family transporter [Arthrobacter sp. H5]|uniref:DMT family transporter n=1 Tax=Arthrobacter sp. H5 TaxID=1267973 RepID=UPI000481437A|nr:DMT family transporter [Arthrobacter sp. H5]
MSHQSHLPAVIGLPLAMLAGVAIPLQGRVNGALGTRLDDGIAAALVSFGTGLVFMVIISLTVPRGRAGLKELLPSIREHRFPRIYLAAGMIGALFVFSQSLTIGLLGVALFTVAAVMGQTLSGLLVDRAGIGPGGRRRVTPMRLIGVVLTVASVVWAVSPRLGGTGQVAELLLPLMLPVLAGIMMSYQQAMNGTAAVHYGTPITATLVNFIAGTSLLLAAWLVKIAVAGVGEPLPAEWWYYVGGPMGCVFIGVGALLVRSLGVLLTGLGMIAGQLVGSLVLDLLVPTPGTVIALATVAGPVLTLGAIVLTTLPWPRRTRRTR